MHALKSQVNLRSPEFRAVVDSRFPGYAKPAFLR